MFDLIQPTPASIVEAGAVDPQGPGPQWLARMLDEIDYGMLLLADESTVLHANHVARRELDAEHPLQLLGTQLRVRHAADLAPLRSALADATRRGLRRLVTLGAGPQRVTLAVVPLAAAGVGDAAAEAHALLVFGKRRVCPDLSAHWFARDHGLTPAEARVLAALCEGLAPGAIAAAQGVAMSTVRSQIGAIRSKTGTASIRDLVRRVAVLPPLVTALRCPALH